MAKKLDSPCMFCGGIPCTCPGGTTKKSSKRTVKASSKTGRTTSKTSPASTPKSSATEVEKEDVFANHQTVTSRFSSVTTEDRDLSYLSALRVLRTSGILTEKSEAQVDAELARDYPQELDRRVHVWKGKTAR